MENTTATSQNPEQASTPPRDQNQQTGDDATIDERSQGANPSASSSSQEEPVGRQAQANAWVNAGADDESRGRRTRISAEAPPPEGGFNKAARAAGGAVGKLFMLIAKMFRELLQGLFGKITNNDLKGEREALDEAVRERQKALAELNDKERDLAHELNRERNDLQETREKGRADSVQQSLKDMAQQLQGGATQEPAKEQARTVQVGEVTRGASELNESLRDQATLKTGQSVNRAPGGLEMRQDAGLPAGKSTWKSRAMLYAEDITNVKPYDELYVSELMGAGKRLPISKESLDEVRRMVNGFAKARGVDAPETMEERLPRMLAAVAYMQAAHNALEAGVSNQNLAMPSPEDMRQRVDALAKQITVEAVKGESDELRISDHLVMRASQTLEQLEDMRAALNQIGVHVDNRAFALGHDGPEQEGKTHDGGNPSARGNSPGM